VQANEIRQHLYSSQVSIPLLSFFLQFNPTIIQLDERKGGKTREELFENFYFAKTIMGKIVLVIMQTIQRNAKMGGWGRILVAVAGFPMSELRFMTAARAASSSP
jgi:hypothetical protein